MIYPITMYAIKCDRCELKYEESSTGFSCSVDESSIWEMANSDDWLEIENKHYCPDCWRWTENGEEIIPKPPIITTP